MGPGPQQDDQKLKELLLYVALRSQDDPKFGMVKLNKILFFIDFRSYRFTGKAVTGAEYQKQPMGPTVRRMKPVLAKLAPSEAIVQDVQYYNLKQNRLIALRPPDLQAFTQEEVALVDGVIDELRPYGAEEISEISHDFIGWKVANIGETIPYQSALIANREPSMGEYMHGLALARQLGYAGT